jgi:ribonuclease HI
VQSSKCKVIVHTDGAARGNPGPAGIGIVIKKGAQTLAEISDYIGETTNNTAEYTALVRGLEETLKLGYQTADFYLDSELLVKQIKGEYRVKNEGLKPLFHRAQELIKKFHSFSIHHTARGNNHAADRLANEGIDTR